MGCTASTTDTTKSAHNNSSSNIMVKNYNTRGNVDYDYENAELLDREEVDYDNEETIQGNIIENDAAVKIQSNFRGYQTRKLYNKNRFEDSYEDMKEDETPKNETDEHKAATTIQAGFKGYKVRKDIKKQKSDSNSEEGSPKKGDKGSVTDEIADIDLNDPEVEKAATKIQATFRGYKSRREPKQE